MRSGVSLRPRGGIDLDARMTFLPADPAAVPVFKGATLVVADVSRGNVGQLAADLLITTLQLRRIGYFDDPDVLPAVGEQPHRSPRFCTYACACTRYAALFVRCVLR